MLWNLDIPTEPVSTEIIASPASRKVRVSAVYSKVLRRSDDDADRRQNERLCEIGRACAIVAHEIKNPLAAMRATIQSIECDAAAAGLSDPISAVEEELDRLDRFLQELLGFVRHAAPSMVRTDVRQVIESARRAAGARLRGLAFTASCAAPRVHCDPDQIEQVLLNLFLNAAEAMPHGGTLAVRAGVESDDLVIRVDDEGVGVPPELREHVFDAFFTTKPRGTGLGLTVCQRIVDDHGGSISLERRRSGRGTSVRVTLPLSRSE